MKGPWEWSWLFAGLLLMGITGCATVGEEEAAESMARPQTGVYHKVNKGETVWRIAKTYQVDLGDIIAANQIPDVANIEQGQLLFIPGAQQVREAVADEEDRNKDEFNWPIQGRVIHYFGERKSGYFYKGIGIQAQEGQTVHAARQGKVLFADYLAGYAYTVMLDHQDGYVSVYGMNSKLLVNLGSTVSKGDSLAQIGNGGDQTFSYFEIRKNTIAQNPLYYLPKL